MIVAGWGRASEGDADAISRALFDPLYGQPLGLRELDISALRASAALGAWADYAVAREAAVERLLRSRWRADRRGGGPARRRSRTRFASARSRAPPTSSRR